MTVTMEYSWYWIRLWKLKMFKTNRKWKTWSTNSVLLNDNEKNPLFLIQDHKFKYNYVSYPFGSLGKCHVNSPYFWNWERKLCPFWKPCGLLIVTVDETHLSAAVMDELWGPLHQVRSPGSLMSCPYTNCWTKTQPLNSAIGLRFFTVNQHLACSIMQFKCGNIGELYFENYKMPNKQRTHGGTPSQHSQQCLTAHVSECTPVCMWRSGRNTNLQTSNNESQLTSPEHQPGVRHWALFLRDLI